MVCNQLQNPSSSFTFFLFLLLKICNQLKNLLFQHFDSFLLYFHTKTQSQFDLGLKTKMIGFLQICVDLCSRMDVRRGSFGPACIKVHTRVRLIYLHCDLERIILKPIDHQGYCCRSMQRIRPNKRSFEE